MCKGLLSSVCAAKPGVLHESLQFALFCLSHKTFQYMQLVLATRAFSSKAKNVYSLEAWEMGRGMAK